MKVRRMVVGHLMMKIYRRKVEHQGMRGGGSSLYTNWRIYPDDVCNLGDTMVLQFKFVRIIKQDVIRVE